MKESVHFTVIGDDKLHCSGCEQRVGRALKREPGVEAVQASFKTQKVDVTYDPQKTDRQKLRERLNLLGYEVNQDDRTAQH